MRVRSLTRHSRSRLGRLASSSAIVGMRAMVQWPRSPRSHPKNPRFSNSVSSRSVFARRCSRDTATLEGWITCASTPCARSQRANQKPSRPASKASAIRVIWRPALTASSRQRCSRPSSLSALGSSFLRGWRSMPGSIPATSQLDWLISTTAMIVLSWSRATRDLLKSFGWGIGALHRLATATMVPSPRRLPHSISRSPVSGDTPQRPLIASPGIISAKSRLALRTKGFDPFAEILRASPESHRFLAKVPRSTPPGHAAACISENARASKRQLVSRLSKERRARPSADGRHDHHACG